jgi:IS5 family transposase
VVDEVDRGKNRTKSGVRAKVEHSFGVIKRVIGFAKVRTAAWRRTNSGHASAAVSPICSWSGIGCSAPDRSIMSGVLQPTLK